MQIDIAVVETWMDKIERSKFTTFERKWRHLKRLIEIEKDLYNAGAILQELQHGKN